MICGGQFPVRIWLFYFHYNNLQCTTKDVVLWTVPPYPLSAVHLYSPASSRETRSILYSKELTPLTIPSVISVEDGPNHFNVDAGLLDTVQFRSADSVSLAAGDAVFAIGEAVEGNDTRIIVQCIKVYILTRSSCSQYKQRRNQTVP